VESTAPRTVVDTGPMLGATLPGSAGPETSAIAGVKDGKEVTVAVGLSMTMLNPTGDNLERLDLIIRACSCRATAREPPVAPVSPVTVPTTSHDVAAFDRRFPPRLAPTFGVKGTSEPGADVTPA
jgi:hypothetical protein